MTTTSKINERESTIDAAIVKAYVAFDDAVHAAKRASDKIRYAVNPVADYSGYGETRYFFKNENGTETNYSIDEVRSRVDSGFFSTYRLIDVANALAAYDTAKATVAAKFDAYQDADARYEGWSRFYLVPGGHIHSSTDCSSCNKGQSPTTFMWLTDLSGLTEADAVAAHGAWLCTVCFPSAPVEYTNGEELAKAAKKAAQCQFSGTYSASHPYGGSTRCECGRWVAVTSRGKIRAHKPEGA